MSKTTHARTFLNIKTHDVFVLSKKFVLFLVNTEQFVLILMSKLRLYVQHMSMLCPSIMFKNCKNILKIISIELKTKEKILGDKNIPLFFFFEYKDPIFIFKY
jgi:hypothetical protein